MAKTFQISRISFLLATALLAMANLARADGGCTNFAQPHAQAIVRPGHPRLYFNSDNIGLLRAHWSDPRFSACVNRINIKAAATTNTQVTTNERALANALKYLATRDPACADRAIADAEALLTADDSVSQNGYNDHCWTPALVFDWCHDRLTPTVKNNFVTNLVAKQLYNEDKIVHHFVLHELFWKGLNPYLSICLSLANEPGVDARLSNAQNTILNYIDLLNELHRDGGWRDYCVEIKYVLSPVYLWDSATINSGYLQKTAFATNAIKYQACHLSRNRHSLTVAEQDTQCDASGIQHVPPDPYFYFMAAKQFNLPLAQWLGNQALADPDLVEFASPYIRSPSWLALVHYDPSQPSQSPAASGLQPVIYFKDAGIVSFRSGWHYDPEPEQDVEAFFYCGYAADHTTKSQNHLEIWRGNDCLAPRGGNYFDNSTSAYGKNFLNQSISRNTLLFTPQGAQYPDVQGGSSEAGTDVPGRYDDALDRRMFPVMGKLSPYTHEPIFRGDMVYFQDENGYAVATGDASFAYQGGNNPKTAYINALTQVSVPYTKVKYFLRDVVYIKPDIFIINDRFAADSSVPLANIRFLLYTQGRPAWRNNVAVNIIKGTLNAGVHESVTATDFFSLEYGNSRLETTLIWPRAAKFRRTGGREGKTSATWYETYVDGVEIDPAVNHQPGLFDPGLLAYTTNQWRSEIEVTPEQAGGNLITAIYLCAKGYAGQKPSFSYAPATDGKTVNIMYQGKNYSIFLPLGTNGHPRVTAPATGKPADAKRADVTGRNTTLL